MSGNSTLPQRSKGLSRGKGFKPRSKPLAVRAGLTARTGLSRTARISPVSDKRAGQNRERAKLIRELFPEPVRCARPGCTRTADDVHEILPRARTGGLITDPSIWAPMCRQDNDEATLEPPWAYEAGLLFHSWQAAKAHAAGLAAGEGDAA